MTWYRTRTLGGYSGMSEHNLTAFGWLGVLWEADKVFFNYIHLISTTWNTYTLCYRLRFLYMGRYGYNDLESEFFGLSEIVSTEYHLIYVISLHQRPLTSWVFRSCFNSIEYVGETITFVLVFRFKFHLWGKEKPQQFIWPKGDRTLVS